MSTLREALQTLLVRTEAFWALLQGEYGVKISSEDHDDHNVYEFFAAMEQARAALAESGREGWVSVRRVDLENIVRWRERCAAYDADMGHEPRVFCEDVALIEQAVDSILFSAAPAQAAGEEQNAAGRSGSSIGSATATDATAATAAPIAEPAPGSTVQTGHGHITGSADVDAMNANAWREDNPPPAAEPSRAGESKMPEDARIFSDRDESTPFADGSGLVRKSDYDKLRQWASEEHEARVKAEKERDTYWSNAETRATAAESQLAAMRGVLISARVVVAEMRALSPKVYDALGCSLDEIDAALAAKDARRLDELQRRMLALDTEWGQHKETVLILRWGNTPVGANIRAAIDAALDREGKG